MRSRATGERCTMPVSWSVGRRGLCGTDDSRHRTHQASRSCLLNRVSGGVLNLQNRGRTGIALVRRPSRDKNPIITCGELTVPAQRLESLRQTPRWRLVGRDIPGRVNSSSWSPPNRSPYRRRSCSQCPH